MPALTGTALTLKMMGKALLKDMAKKAVKATAKKAVKSVVKKKKVKGKDVANKMFGGGGGGALALRPKADLVPSPGGAIGLSKPEKGGEIVKVSGGAAKNLGLTPFMDSLTTIQVNVDDIKATINDNNKDAVKRLEKQRVQNANLKKKAREKLLESGGKVGKAVVAPVKDMADNFLSKLVKFFTMTLLGVLVNALIGGSRDIVVAFIAGIKAYTMASRAFMKFLLKIRKGVATALSKAGTNLGKAGKAIKDIFFKAAPKIVNWIKNKAKLIKEGIKQSVEFLADVAKNPRQKLKTITEGLKNSKIGKNVKNVLNAVKTPKKTIMELGKKISNTGVGKKVGSVINKGKNIWKNMKNTAGKTGGWWKGIKNWGARKGKEALEFGSKQWKKATKWADDIAKKATKWTDDIIKGGLEKAKKWRKQLGDMAEMVKNPGKLADKVKGMLKGKVDKLLDSNDIVKKVKDLAKDPKKAIDGIKKFVKNVGKNKNILKTRKVLEKGAKLKIAGLDAVLAALMGVIDYTAFGESPINAVLRAAGALVGYTAGFAIGSPFGGVPGFITGMAGGWVGEKAADLIAAGLSKTKLGSTPDPIMDDGRMLVRDPLSGQGEGERMDNIQDAKLGETSKEDVSKDISSSASYEDGADSSTIVMDGSGGEETNTSSSSQAGKVKFINVQADEASIADGSYKNQATNSLYKG